MNQNFVSVFGDKSTVHRIPDILVQFQYNISTDDTSEATTGTGATSHADATATLSTGASTGTCSLTSLDILRYSPGFEAYAFFTAAFSSADAGTYQRVGLFDSENGFWLGFEDGTFYIAYRHNSTDYKTAVGSGYAEIDVPDGLDWTKINIYRISYGWLGIAPIVFEVYYNQEWKKIGIIDLTNAQTDPSIRQPSQPIHMEVGRTSGSGAVTIKTCSWSAGRSGGPSEDHDPAKRPHALDTEKTGISTETNVITIRNNSTFQSLTNHVVAKGLLFGCAVDGTKNAVVRMIRNATLGGSPSYTEVDATNSIMSYDTAGTTVTGGTEVMAIPLAKVDSELINVAPFNLRLHPGETMTFSAQSSQSTDVAIAIDWEELF